MALTPGDIQLLQREVEHLREENLILRGMLARTTAPCYYCQLPAGKTSECARGFPGCLRMEDVIRDPGFLAGETITADDDVFDRPTVPDLVAVDAGPFKKIPDTGVSRIDLHNIDPDEDE